MEDWRFKAISITKYKPDNYNVDGVYTKDEWTSFTDIGKSYDDIEFTKNEYLKSEDAYIASALIFMNFIKAKKAELFEVYNTNSELCRERDPDLYDVCLSMKNGLIVQEQEISKTIKIILREYAQASFILDRDTQSYIYFGYDYYMYFVSDKKIVALKDAIESTGLFFNK